MASRDHSACQPAPGVEPDSNSALASSSCGQDTLPSALSSYPSASDPVVQLAPTYTFVDRPTTVESRFVVVRHFAKGGVGEVFVAQDRDLHREVAIKTMQARYANDNVCRSRFLLEAEVTARLEHPGVVPVYALGQYADGRPYYAMRLIEGESLKEAIDRYHGRGPAQPVATPGLSLSRLLRRFIDVCNAIAYAHSRGIVHRDLKPNNILLGKYGETLVVDWGLAKAMTESALPPTTVADASTLIPVGIADENLTELGAALGTPQYMSPEQAAGRLDLLGPPSDVYSLGATLYSILTGKAPFGRSSSGEVLRQVQRGDFLPPRRIKSDIPPALNAICLKAMALAPNDRYVTPLALAEDIEHWLADEPITALREGWLQRAARWGRRHRAALRIATATLVFVTATSVAATLLIGRARERAMLDRDAARIAIDNYVKAIDDEEILQHERFRPLRQRLLFDARRYYEDFIVQHGDDPDVEEQLARALAALGEIDLWSGSQEEAERAHRRAVLVLQRLVARSPHRADLEAALAASHDALGWIYQIRRRSDDALREYERALEIRSRLAGAAPENAQHQRDLAQSYEYLGDIRRERHELPAAMESYRRLFETAQTALISHPNDPEIRGKLADAYSGMGHVDQEMGRRGSARDNYERALAIRSELSQEDPFDTDLQAGLAYILDSLGEIAHSEDRDELARGYYNRALTIRRELASNNPHEHQFRNDLAGSLATLGRFQLAAGDYAAALASQKEALAIEQLLYQANPQVVEYEEMLAIANQDLGWVWQHLGDHQAAMDSFQHAVKIASKLAAEHRSHDYHRSLLGDALWRVASLNLILKQHAAAAAAVDEFARCRPTDRDSLFNVARVLAQCRSQVAEGNPAPSAEDEALRRAYGERALAMLRAAVEAGFDDKSRVIGDADLQRLRGLPGFDEVMAKIKG